MGLQAGEVVIIASSLVRAFYFLENQDFSQVFLKVQDHQSALLYALITLTKVWTQNVLSGKSGAHDVVSQTLYHLLCTKHIILMPIICIT